MPEPGVGPWVIKASALLYKLECMHILCVCRCIITNLYQARLISGQEAWEPDVGAATRPSWILECLRGKRLLKVQASCWRDYRAEGYQEDLFVCVSRETLLLTRVGHMELGLHVGYRIC